MTGLHPHVEAMFAFDPILASAEGDVRGDARLGDLDPDARAERTAQLRRALADAESQEPAAPGTLERLDQDVLLTELRVAVHTEEVVRPAERAPYWYAERLGQAFSVVMARGTEASQEAVRDRLRAVPAWCEQAARNLTRDTPALWAESGVAATRGLERFVGTAVPAYAAGLPAALRAEVESAAARAAEAVATFADAVGGLDARGSWVAGREHVDLLLRELHHLDLDADGLAEHGRAQVERERAALEDLAAACDPTRSWQEQVDRVKDWHPAEDAFVETYRAAMEEARAHTLAHDLVTVPAEADCVVGTVPDYEREGTPLGLMRPTPPYAEDLRSDFLITPGDPDAPDDRREQHRRDNCFVFAASIAGHETYPGHHVQHVHHKLGTPRDSIRRWFRTPQSVEGWGLYVEDLLEETGFMADERRLLLKRRNGLWRALRIVVDAGLHTGTTTLDEATDLLCREAGMDRHMAAGEVRRYARHDNPTYPSSYVLGRDLIHRLRETRREVEGESFTLRGFHDWLLALGSPPLPLLDGLARAR